MPFLNSRHESWLAPLLGRKMAVVYRAVALRPLQGRGASSGAVALNYFAAACRGVLGLASAAVFLVAIVLQLWDTWVDKFAYVLGLTAGAGLLWCAVRILLMKVVTRPALLSPWNFDLVWQAGVGAILATIL